MATTKREAKRRGTWRTTNDGRPFRNNGPNMALTAYMMLRKSQAFGFNS